MDIIAEKQALAKAALSYVPDGGILGVGTGTTVNIFIEALAGIQSRLDGVVSSSEATTERLKQHGIPVFDLNTVDSVPVYIDGADEVNPLGQTIKGGGGALTREKILATVAKQFICLADKRKQVKRLGTFPLAVEVIPMARSYVARELVKLGGSPVYRQGFVTDNGNIILDTHDLIIDEPIALEQKINNLTGVVCHGLFAVRCADVVL